MPASAPRTGRATPRLAATVVFLALAAGGLVACDRDKSGDAETFCGRVAEHVEELRANPATAAEIEALIELWTDIGEDAPLEIERDWNAYIDNLQVVWTADDQEEVMASAFASERSALAIATWVRERCGVEWGPVTTIVAHGAPESSVPASTQASG